MSPRTFTIAATAVSAAIAAGTDAAFDYEDFHRYDQIVTEMTVLAGDPRAVLEPFGDSYEGRAMYVLKISSSQGGACTIKPAILLTGAQHGDEYTSAMVPLKMASRLLDGSIDSNQILDTVDVYVVPVVNPDGYEHTWVVDRLWNKSRSLNPNQITRGTDLDRNWDYRWGDERTTFPEEATETSNDYGGPSAASEIEVEKLAEWIGLHSEIIGHLDYHDFNPVDDCASNPYSDTVFTQSLFLYPWSDRSSPVPAELPELQLLAQRMASAAGPGGTSGSYYDTLAWELWWSPTGCDWPPSGHEFAPNTGSIIDWAYGVHGIFSFEVMIERDEFSTNLLAPAYVMQWNALDAFVDELDLNGLADPILLAPPENGCASPGAINVGDTVAFDTTCASTDGPAHPEGQVYNDFWYRYNADQAGIIEVSTCGLADFDTRVAVYEAVTCPVDDTRLLAFADDTGGCAGGTTIATAEVQAGVDYLIRIGGADANQWGSGAVTLGFEPAPTTYEIVTELVDPDAVGWDLAGYDAGTYDTYRAYAAFDQPVWVIGVGDAYLDEYSFGCDVDDSGGFFNTLTDTGADSDLPPDPGLFANDPSFRWDTFVTIGESIVPTGGTAMTELAPDFTTQASGLDDGFMLDGTGWYVSGFPSHTFGDRVLIAQFTVGQGAQVTGTNWRISYNVGAEGGSTHHVFADFVTQDPCPLDFDGNDGVRFEDLTQLLGRWGSCPGCIEDINGDGVVGFSDLTALLTAWGACP